MSSGPTQHAARANGAEDLRVVGAVARATARDLRLIRRMAGGEQGGALLVEQGDGTRFVLKTEREPWKTARLRAAAPVMRAAIAGGWAAAAWLQIGDLPGGVAFIVQEHRDAAPITSLDEDTARAVIALNRSQQGLGSTLGAAFDDSAQLLAVLSDHPWRTNVATRSDTGAAVVREATRLHRQRGTAHLPDDDVVHGDTSAANLLRDVSGRVWAVDTETVGRGTRVRDLADLVRQARVAAGDETAGTRNLTEEALTAAGPAVFVTCLAAVSLDNLAWWAERRSAREFDDACVRVGRLLAAVSG